MKQLLFIASLFVAVSLPAQVTNRHIVKVGDFTQLVISNSINVDYKSNPDSAGIAVFVATADMASHILFDSNNKGKLTIYTDINDKKAPGNIPTVTVYSRSLRKITNMGDSTVRAFRIINGDGFKAHLEGNGRLSLREIDAMSVNAKIFTGRGQIAIDGKCDIANLSCTGVGTIQADGLKATDAIVTVNGTGSIGCMATNQLTIKGMGTGKVYYGGNPSIVKNRSIGIDAVAM